MQYSTEFKSFGKLNTMKNEFHNIATFFVTNSNFHFHAVHCNVKGLHIRLFLPVDNVR